MKRFDPTAIPSQRNFFESIEPSVLFSGSVGAGKTQGGVEKGLHFALTYPGSTGLISRKYFNTIKHTSMKSFEEACPKEYIKSFSKAFNQPPNVCELINGSEVLFMGLDDPQKAGSLNLAWCFMDEMIEFTEEDYFMLESRLRQTVITGSDGIERELPIRQIFGATNPAYPAHWLYRLAFDDHMMEIFQSNSLENPFLPDDYIARLKRYKPDSIAYRRYVLGEWVGNEGTVYDTYDPDKHLIPSFEIPSDWRRYLGIDFGYSNPFSALWLAKHPFVDPDYNCQCPAPVHAGFYLYREIYMSNRTTDIHAQHILELTGDEKLDYVFADWAAGDRALLEKYGVYTIKADKEISAGIQSVYNLFSNDLIHIFDNALVEEDRILREGKIRRPVCLSEELLGYKYREPDIKNIRSFREEPQDKDNHGCDALRYIVHTLGLQPEIEQIISRGVHIRSDNRFASTHSWGTPGIGHDILKRIGAKWS